MKILIYMMVLSYSLSRYYDLSFMYLVSDGEWWQYFTYIFSHNSFAHLMVNIAMLIIYREVLSKTNPTRMIAFTSILSCIISSYLCSRPIPTAGASTIVFSLMGIFTANLWSSGNKDKLRYTLTLLATMTIQTLIGFKSVNWQLHLFSYGISITLYLLYGHFRKGHR